MDQRRLSRIEVFVFDSPEPIHYGMEAEPDSRYGILKLTCKGGSSWRACLISANTKPFDLIKWSSFLRMIYHCRLEEAIDKVRTHGSEWDQTQFELVQGALQDLKAKLQGKSFAGHIEQGRLYRAVAGGRDSRGGRLYYKPSKAMSSVALQKHSYPEPDNNELINKSISYFSIL